MYLTFKGRSNAYKNIIESLCKMLQYPQEFYGKISTTLQKPTINLSGVFLISILKLYISTSEEF